MKSILIFLGAFLCAANNLCAQVSVIENGGVRYQVKSGIDVNYDNITFTRSKDDKAQYQYKGTTLSPYFDYKDYATNGETFHATLTLDVNGETIFVEPQSAVKESSEVKVDVFTPAFPENEVRVLTPLDADKSEYSAYCEALVKLSENGLEAAANGKGAVVRYYRYKDISTSNNYKIYYKGNSYNYNQFSKQLENLSLDADNLYLLYIVGNSIFKTTNAYVVEKITADVDMKWRYSDGVKCVPASIPAEVDWKNSVVNVSECVKDIADGAFATADYAVREIGENQNYTEVESLVKTSSKGNARTGLYVGNKGFRNAQDVYSWLSTFSETNDVKGLCYVDMTMSFASGVLSINDFSVASENDDNKFNANCLYYFPSNISVGGKNSIANGVCTDLSLVRDASAPFYNTKSFKANNVTMQTSLSSKLVGYCFPFEVKGNISFDGNEAMPVADVLRILDFQGYESDVKSLYFAYVPTAKANVPCVIGVKDGGSCTSFSLTDVEVAATEPNVILNTEDMGGWRMFGTYQSVTMENEGYVYYGFANSLLSKAGYHAATAKPFSGMVLCTDMNHAEVKMRVIDADDMVSAIDVNDADVFSVEAQYGALTISGSSAVKVVSVAGVVVFNGVVDGTKTIELASGVYVVNGKKYIVK